MLFEISWFCPTYIKEKSCESYYSLPWEPCSHYCGKPDAITSITITFYPLLLILGIFILPYFASCFIVWIYDKIKVKKK